MFKIYFEEREKLYTAFSGYEGSLCRKEYAIHMVHKTNAYMAYHKLSLHLSIEV